MEENNRKSESNYDFKKIEPKIRKFWEEEKIFKFDKEKKDPYSIDMPPPTVSGKMHIGHAFSYTQQDFIARYRRMKQGVFYPFGTDDNGLPTEKLVERLNNVKSKDMSRTDFIKLCLKTLKEITPDFVEDWKRIGVSADYEIYYSTINDNSRKISQKSFIELFKKGLAYEKDFPTLWCTECGMAVAQAELEDEERNSKFVFIKAEVEGMNPIIFATTRPELLHSCVCISVHKDDKRYKKYIGKKAKIPISSAVVPIITDDHAKMDLGTGAVYWCPYGDKNDINFIERHPEFKAVPVLNKDGTLNSGAKKYEGLKVDEARKKIIKDLIDIKAVEKVEDISNVTNTHERCGTSIEFVPTNQWFIKIIDKKEELIKVGKEVKWYPNHMFKRYENWIKGLDWDWAISRDRHFGVPIPIWKCKGCDFIILPKESELPVDPIQTKKECPRCKIEAIPEKKVLDTWATSSLTPKIASSLIKDNIRIPYSLRPQGHDIIRTWAFYTITKALLHENKIPWKEIIISGMVTRKGEKMSKSKGNGVDPVEVLEEYGADALRFWAAGSKLGGDLDYQEQDLIAGRKTVKKLWNASKFVFMNLEDYNGEKPKKLEKLDKEFLKELDHLVSKVTFNFNKYQYSFSKADTEKIFWKDFADNYIEAVKGRIYNQTGDKKISAQYTLYKSLLIILKLFSPIIPFVTEEIYQTYFRKKEKDKSIHISNWPGSSKKAALSKDFRFFCDFLSKIRQEKTKAQKSMNSEIILTLSKENIKALKNMREDFIAVTNSKEIKEGKFKVDFI